MATESISYARLIQIFSKTKRQSFFNWLTDDEARRFEALVVEAFGDRK
jgi:hypothetical protein